jgi:hypothetical protein
MKHLHGDEFRLQLSGLADGFSLLEDCWSASVVRFCSDSLKARGIDGQRLAQLIDDAIESVPLKKKYVWMRADNEIRLIGPEGLIASIRTAYDVGEGKIFYTMHAEGLVAKNPVYVMSRIRKFEKIDENEIDMSILGE